MNPMVLFLFILKGKGRLKKRENFKFLPLRGHNQKQNINNDDNRHENPCEIISWKPIFI